MSYTAFSAFGETSDWWGCSSSASEVYVWRAVLNNIELNEPTDALLFVDPVGKGGDGFHVGADVRGVVVDKLGDGSWGIDVVMTVKLGNPLYTWCMPPIISPVDAKDIAKLVLGDSAIQLRFPGLTVDKPKLLQLTGPPPAVAFWLAHHLLFDEGKRTLKYGTIDGVYLGAADDAPNLKDWKPEEVPLGGGGKSKINTKVVGVAIAAAVVLVAWGISTGNKGSRSKS